MKLQVIDGHVCRDAKHDQLRTLLPPYSVRSSTVTRLRRRLAMASPVQGATTVGLLVP